MRFGDSGEDRVMPRRCRGLVEMAVLDLRR